MSPNRPPAIDLKALQDRLHDLTAQKLVQSSPRPGDGDLGAPAICSARRQDGEPSGEPPTSLPVPRLGAEAAANMTKLSKAAAEDIRQLGRLAFDAGKRVQEECEEMARDVEANGGMVASHLTGLSQLLADVGMSNRETLHRLLGGASPSIVPPAVNGHGTEPASGSAKPLPTAPSGKADGGTE
jgi:hypothetical protein